MQISLQNTNLEINMKEHRIRVFLFRSTPNYDNATLGNLSNNEALLLGRMLNVNYKKLNDAKQLDIANAVRHVGFNGRNVLLSRLTHTAPTAVDEPSADFDHVLIRMPTEDSEFSNKLDAVTLFSICEPELSNVTEDEVAELANDLVWGGIRTMAVDPNNRIIQISAEEVEFYFQWIKSIVEAMISIQRTGKQLINLQVDRYNHVTLLSFKSRQ